MFYRYAADAVLLTHFAFIVFAVFGGLLTICWRKAPFIHLPAVAWAVIVEITGRLCPLTYLENSLLTKAGEAGYAESFIEHYLFAIIYPEGLTRELQYFLAALVFIINAVIYLWLFYRARRAGRKVG